MFSCELGRGTFVQLTALSSGPHEITLTAGGRERQGRMSVSISVGDETTTGNEA
jgi:hypothetical protein